MNKLSRDPAQQYAPTKFDRNQRIIAPRRAVTGLAGQNN